MTPWDRYWPPQIGRPVHEPGRQVHRGNVLEREQGMTGLEDAFGPFDGRVWLNTGQQGPLPRCAAEAARRAIEHKVKPAQLSEDLFDEVPSRLRAALAALLGAPVEEVMLGNSASHGLHQIILGFPWMRGDEVLLVSGDFPATTTPWRLATSHDVRIRWLDNAPVTPEALDQAIGPSTRIFCTTWVHSFVGHALDLPALREVCRRRGVWFVVNASQALGTLPLTSVVDVADAITACGHKFLCGPYGTGVCWICSELLARLRPAQATGASAWNPGASSVRATLVGRAPHMDDTSRCSARQTSSPLWRGRLRWNSS